MCWLYKKFWSGLGSNPWSEGNVASGAQNIAHPSVPAAHISAPLAHKQAQAPVLTYILDPTYPHVYPPASFLLSHI